MNLYKKWASREYPLGARLLALIPAGALIAGLIPYFLLVSGPRLDASLGLPDFNFGWINPLAGGLLILIGLYYAYASIGQQLFDVGGTPLPMMATQKLLIRGVFNQCRNPMTFGTICAYTGLAVLKGSISSLVITFLIAGLLMLYLKKIEERELEQRFGDSYLIYKKSTPFIFPRIRRRKSG